jgi:hypothetical protein
MSKIVLLAILVSLTGCMSVRHSEFIVPARCVRVSVQSFTRPCTQLVVISARWVAPPVSAAAR